MGIMFKNIPLYMGNAEFLSATAVVILLGSV